MQRIHSWITSIFVVLAWSCAAVAQSENPLQVTKVFATLEGPVDTLSSSRHEGFALVTLNDVIVNGKVVIPKGAKILGQVVAVTSKGKEASKSVLALSLDRAVTDAGEIPLQAIIVAVAAPKKSELEVSANPIVPNGSKGSAPAENMVNSGDVTLLLTDNSQGVLGFEDVSISWQLSVPPALTILATRAKRLRLEAGSQMLLRMMPPKTSN
ncbi:MAG TPA: hypothetical protein VN696_08320 [Pyrinomonadaceae bacterium]|nr:hypothetical protein [Pyrinomonadaceae bacterium]